MDLCKQCQATLENLGIALENHGNALGPLQTLCDACGLRNADTDGFVEPRGLSLIKALVFENG